MWCAHLATSIKELFNVLGVAKMTMDSISKETATLLTAEGAFDQLELIYTTLSSELLQQLKTGIALRRQKTLVSLMKFLTNPKSFAEDTDKSSFFAMSSRKVVFALATQIWNGSFKGKANNSKDFAQASHVSESEDPDGDDEPFLSDRLEMSIGKRTKSAAHGNSAIFNRTDDRFEIHQDRLSKLRVHTCLASSYEANP